MAGAYEIPGFKLGPIVAGADLSAKQYRFTKIHASGRLIVCSSQGEVSVGILQNKPISGVSAEIDGDGVSLLVLGGTVAPGDVVTTDANGAGIKASSTEHGLALALNIGGASGEIIPVYQKPSGKV